MPSRYLALAAFFCGNVCWGQATLSLSSGSGLPGGTVTLSLSFNNTSGQASAVQWTIATDSNVTSAKITASAALTAAGKTIVCAGVSGGYTCVAAGMNANIVPNGVIASVQFTLSPTSASLKVGITNPVVASASGSSIPVSATGGSMSIGVSALASLSSLACSPATLGPGASATCTVAVSMAAPAGGMIVSLSDDSAVLSVPASVTVPGGASSAVFTATAGGFTSGRTVTITAALSGSVKTAALSLVTAVSLSSLSCAPTALGPGASAACTVALSGAAPSGGATISLSDNSSALAVPAAVNVAGGAVSAAFPVVAGAVSSAQTVTVTARLGSASATAAVTLSPTSLSTIRINAGGSAYTDPAGQTWAADNSFTGGYNWAVSNPISNTTTPTLYQTSRWSSSPFGYTFTVPNGTYTVTLKFAEPYFWTVGSRAFNVAINGTTVLSNFDIFAQAGGQFIALDKAFPVTVTNGQVVIQFTLGSANNPIISAIDIEPGPPPQTNVRVNAGGPAYTDPSGNIWAADKGFSGGNTYAVYDQITNTITPTLYQTCRYSSSFSYTFAVPNGTYKVTLKFAEPYFWTAGSRAFNVTINGTTVLSNFDIFAQAGGQFIALDKAFPVTVTGGQIVLQFTSGRANLPMVNAIEITH